MVVKNLVVVNDYAHVSGGASQVAINSARGMSARGLRVHFLAAVGPVDPGLPAAGVEVTCLGQPDILNNPSRLAAAKSGIWNRAAAQGLEQLLASMDRTSTVVHVHSWSKALSPSVFEVIRRLGFRGVLTEHDFFSVCPNGGFFDYRRHEICHRTALGLDCISTNCDARSYAQKLWRVTRQVVANRFAGLPSGISDVIFLSETSRRVLEPYHDPSVRWHFVRNPVDVDREERVRPGTATDFIYVGRLAPEKGAELFAEAAAEAGVAMRIVGDGDMRADIQKRFPAVTFSGWLPKAGVIGAIRSSRCLVFPSRWYETFGLTVYEAMAQGVPVIVAEGCAAADAVTHGRNGLLFPRNDGAALAAALRQYSDDARVEDASRAAYEGYWTDPPSLESHCRTLAAVYDQL